MELLRRTLGSCYRFLFPAEQSMERSPGSRSEERPLASSSTPKMLSDHIYELYQPKEEPTMEILFFHGLQFKNSTEVYLSTWTCGDGSGQIWPSSWLADEFPRAKMFSVTYDACVEKTKEQGRFDLHNVTENLMWAIQSAHIGHLPVILVGHCFGGLVIKDLLVKAHHTYSLGSPSDDLSHIKRFLENLGGVFFYGTPHHGSPVFDNLLTYYMEPGPLLDHVKVLSTESARLHVNFVKVCKKYEISRIASVGESRPTSWDSFNCVVVPEASARYGQYYTIAADHIALCKPATKTSNSFQLLKTFLQGIQSKVQVEDGHVEAHFDNIQRTPKPLVGLDLAVRKVEGILQEKKKVGLVGMGGVGKTTLAMAVFNKLGSTFEYTCFIHVMKLVSGGMEDLKKEIWKGLHGKKVDAIYKEGCWSTLRGKRLLLVLDDIFETSNRDLDILSHIADDNGHSESRFIVTSRNRGQLNQLDEIYPVPFLDGSNAKQLFMSCTFPEKLEPPIALESNVEAIIQKCGGLPLTLEVIGKYLRRETNVKVWTETLEDLDKANVIENEDEKLWAQLRLSYDNLTKEHREIFLDVTTFFAGNHWTLREAKAVWTVIYGSGNRQWRSLVDRSLVYSVEEDEEIRVHDQLQSLGRKIAASESEESRIWNHSEVQKLLQSPNEHDDQQVHTLRVGGDMIQHPKNITSSGWRRLKTVRCLDLIDYGIRREYFIRRTNEVFPTDHVVLLGCDGAQFGHLFSKLMLDRLVVLRLSRIPSKLPRCIGQLSALKILNMPDCEELESLPDEIGRLSKLEYLRLANCWSLRELPESFGELSKLKLLELIDCSVLETLPESFGQLLNLKDLKLIGCESLQTLPKSFGQLQALNCLKLEGLCEGMVTLPDSFGDLSALQNLELIGCDSLIKTLPESFGQLGALNYLKLEGDPHSDRMVTALPDSFGDLSALRNLELLFCGLETLPKSFGELRALSSLKLHACEKIVTLPDSFGHMPVLQNLELSACSKLENLPESFGHLPALRNLDIMQCYSLKTLPESFGQLRALNHLKVEEPDEEMVTLPDSFCHLPALQNLEFIDCSELHILPEAFHHLSSLEHLKFHWCPGLYELPKSFGHLPALKHLEFRECHKLHILPESFGQLSTLESLAFHSCANLNELPEFFGQLPKLQHLVIDDCPEIKKLPNSWVDLKVLRLLSIQYIALRSIPDFIESLPSLQTLELGFLPWVTRFPPWLEGVALASPAKTVRRIFHVEHGRFTLHLTEEQDVGIASEWIRAHLLGKEVRDYNEALAALESWGHLRVSLRDLFCAEPKEWILILWKNGNSKRLTGDLYGALEDLDAAVKKCIDTRGSRNIHTRGRSKPVLGTTHLGYICRSERGCVRYLLNDMDGAREDGEAAFKYQSCITDLFISEFIYDSEFDYSLNDMDGLQSGEKRVVHQPVLSYLNFRFLGMVEYRANVELLKSSHYQAMKKVAGSDFAGALADFSLDGVDVRLLGFRVHAFILQERGILKRLTGDLNGALDDLNSALELITQREFTGGDFRFSSGYENLKQRGFVKYRQGDVDGARRDAAAAVRRLKEAPRVEHGMFVTHRDLDVLSEGCPIRERDHGLFEGWQGKPLFVRTGYFRLWEHDHEGWEVAEDEVEVVEGGFLNEWGGYRRLGVQSLKFLGFNLKY